MVSLKGKSNETMLEGDGSKKSDERTGKEVENASDSKFNKLETAESAEMSSKEAMRRKKLEQMEEESKKMQLVFLNIKKYL